MTTSTEGQAPALPRPRAAHRVRTPDGVIVAAQEWGRADGPAIVFVHGYSQCHLCWARQVTGPLADRFRLVTYDLRGHGGSDAPREATFYGEGRRWADELGAVIGHLGLERPVVAGWSYGGRVLAQYLQFHGEADLAGAAFVGARLAADPAIRGPASVHQADMFQEDAATNIEGTIAFLAGCFTRAPAPAEFAVALAYNMMVAPAVRSAMMGSTPNDFRELAPGWKLPVLIVHGAADRVVLPAAAMLSKELVGHARLALYDGVGHSPFHEASDRFDDDLGRFVSEITG